MKKILISIFIFFISPQLLASDLSNYNNNAICHLAIKNNHWETKPNLLKFVEEAQRRGINCGISKSNNSKKKNYSNILGENFESFNKFSKIKV